MPDEKIKVILKNFEEILIKTETRYKQLENEIQEFYKLIKEFEQIKSKKKFIFFKDKKKIVENVREISLIWDKSKRSLSTFVIFLEQNIIANFLIQKKQKLCDAKFFNNLNSHEKEIINTVFTNIKVQSNKTLETSFYEFVINCSNFVSEYKQKIVNINKLISQNGDIEQNTSDILSSIIKIFDSESIIISDIKTISENIQNETQNVFSQNFFNYYDLKEFNIPQNLTPQEIFNLLRENRKMKTNIKPEQLILVHLTKYFPEEGTVIRTLGEVTYKKEIADIQNKNNEGYLPRETLHFTLNGPVQSHNLGNWDKSTVAILIPFNKILPEKIKCLNSADIFTFGCMRLPEGSEIILPSNSNLQSLNSKVQIIKTQEPINDAVNKRILKRGYDILNIGMSHMDTQIIAQNDSENVNVAQEIIRYYNDNKNKYPFLLDGFNNHINTVWSRIEDLVKNFNKYSPEELSQLYDELERRINLKDFDENTAYLVRLKPILETYYEYNIKSKQTNKQKS